ncbi:MAG: integration host factor, actinobacterial type [bacterium]|nr:integration host factor, actinobacterial type [bacterium]
MTPPQLTPEQRAEALKKAARARQKRAEVKQLLKTGSLSMTELLEEAQADPMVAGIKVSAVLASMPRTGKIKSKRLMEKLGIAENRRIRGLGERQRAALLQEFD